MLKFKKLNEKIYGEIRKYILNTKYKACDISLGVFIMWDEQYFYEFAKIENALIVKLKYRGETWFLPPVGDNFDNALKEIENYCVENEMKVRFTCVDDEFLDYFKTRYGGLATVTFNRDYSDYLYNIDDIRAFAGKKYGGQRNHINKFKKLYPDYEFTPLKKSDLSEVKEFLKEYRREHKKMGEVEREEFKNTLKIVENYHPRYFTGGAMRVNGKMVAFTVGEVAGDELIIHVEKALTTYEGAYPATFNAFCKSVLDPAVKYANREDDAGDAGLRTSKTQYHPVSLINKNQIVVNYPMPIKKMPTVKGERVVLNGIKKSDAKAYFKLNTQKANNRYWGYEYKKDIKVLTEDCFYKMQANDFKKGVNACFAIRLSAGGEMLGEAILYNFDYDGFAEIGIRLFKKYQGKGLAYDALNALILYAERDLHLKLKAKCYNKNEKSLQLLTKCGFYKVAKTGKFYRFLRKTPQKTDNDL